MKKILSSGLVWFSVWGLVLLVTGAASVHWSILAGAVIVVLYITDLGAASERRHAERIKQAHDMENRLERSIADAVISSQQSK